MASSSLIRLRRGLKLLSGLHQSSSATAAPFLAPIRGPISSPGSLCESPNVRVQSRSFKSSSISLLSARSAQPNYPDEIGPDTILFEGCDYNHWLFVIDFPKDNKPSPEEMVRVYEETCAKGLNISVEEAKKRMYACSTTTYTGFQAVMTEEESQKFEGLPGVIFVLPDSYIDPVNKEYGGDKYIEGTIIPRPPPVQFGRNPGRRDRRGPDQYNRQENQMPNPQRNPSYNNWGPAPVDGRNNEPSQNYPPKQNYGPAPQQSYPPKPNYGPAPQQSYPPKQNYGPSPQQSYPPQQNYSPASQPSYPPKQNYGPASENYPPKQNINQASHNFPPQQSHGHPSPSYPPPQQNYGQASQTYPPQQTFNQAPQNYPPQQQTYRPASPQYAQQQSFGPPGQGERRGFVPQQNFGQPGGPGQGERRDPMPTDGGRDSTSTPSYLKGFKPSYMEEFEQAEQGNYSAKEQMGSQQRYPPSGPGNFTGEGRYR